MLKLKRLEISGFKSFVDPVTLGFARGITAIVGPNGCGKSNISDSISWVLGEQSAKSLRSSSMEDVIFNGAERRKPLGMAEVTLTLEALPGFAGLEPSQGLAALEDGEVTISRQVFRSGESTYRLNGKRVRLKEIRDLLMDTGLGIRTYSVIEQGKVELILSGKPQERRKLLEEAAGVTRYKARKRIAELKLEETTANLLRLDDILAEVERTLRSLKRQAGAARRFQREQESYRGLLEEVLLGRWSALARTLAGLVQTISTATAREAELAGTLSRTEASLAAGRLEQDRRSAALAELHRRDAELAATIEGRQEYLRGAARNLQQLAERLAAGSALAAQRDGERLQRVETLASLAGRREEMDAAVLEATASLAVDDRALAEAQQRLDEAEVETTRIRERVRQAREDLETARRDLHQRQIEAERSHSRQTHLLDELGSHGQELTTAEETLRAATARVAQLLEVREATTRRREEAERRLDELLAAEAELTTRRGGLEAERTTIEQRLAVLAALAEAQAEARQSLVERLAAAGIDRPVYLSDHLRAPEGWGDSLDGYFGALADAVLLDDARDGVALARMLGESRGGAVLFQAATTRRGTTPASPIDPAIVGSLADELGVGADIAALLPPAYLVESATDAVRLARQHPGCAFVSRERLWAQGGFLHVSGERAQPGVLARKQQRDELEEQLPAVEEQLRGIGNELEAAIERRSRQAQASDQLEHQLGDLRREVAVAEARREDAADRLRRLTQQHGTLDRERQQLEGVLDRLGERRAEAEQRVAAAEQQLAAHEHDLRSAGERVEQLRSLRENHRATNTERRGRLELLSERLEAHDRDRRRLEQEHATLERQLAEWRDEERRLTAGREELDQGVAEARLQLERATDARDASQERVLEAQRHVEEHRESLQEHEAATVTARRELDAIRAEIAEARVARASLDQDAAHLARAYDEHFHAALPEAPGVPPTDLAEREAELARAKQRIEAIGPVNVLAADEYEEQEQRFIHLTEQRTDVARSVESLRRTIREINETSSVRLAETLVAVNQHFGEIFGQLFRGGEAEIRLMDDDDPLESGLEIVARPPGKRLQNLMLMSGGEKALTAIALLMALFKSKPSPFCLLDEVDAPLDDANTLRYVEVLREMSKDTQFLVITHNKLTMEAASTLYGVTMQERGVSKIVSVDLDDVDREQRDTAISA